MIEFGRYLSSGMGIWWAQGAAEPRPLVHALLDQVEDIGPLRAFVGITWDRRLTHDPPSNLGISSYGALGDLYSLHARGRLDVIPCHYSTLPRLFAEGLLPRDVGLVQVSPPDSDGMCSLGLGVDYAADALNHTPVLIAEVNRQMPPTVGSNRIPLSRFSATLNTDRPLAEAPSKEPADIDRRIARQVAQLIDDGSTIQIGVGAIPSAVAEALEAHQDLGLHSGMVSDAVLRLIDNGVMNGARKEIDTGTAVAGAAVGSSSLYRALATRPVEFRPASYTHSPEVLARLGSFLSINSAIEVDLTGQVGSEVRSGTYVGAVGGQVDFSRAAAVTGAKSIIAVRSRARGRSTITATLDGGVVTTGRADVDVVVTEYGVAHLRGCGLAERAKRLIAVAAPEHREALWRASAARGR